MRKLKKVASVAMLMLACLQGWSQEDEVTISIDTLSANVYMLTGQGGNIGLYVGPTKVFMIDDQFAKLSPKIKDAITTLTDKPLTYLFNTHMHGDHTGGNAAFNTENLTLIAQENVRKSLEKTVAEKPELGMAMLPEITFSEELKMYEEDETILAIHVHNAHTNGDALIYFMNNNVIHMGDTYFAGRYPYIDLDNGGSVAGLIAAQKKALLVINEDTMIMPGHGRPSNKKELSRYIAMLETIKANTEAALKAGKTLEEVEKDTSISGVYDEAFGSGFINPKRLRSTFYTCLKK